MSKLETYVRFIHDFDWHVPGRGACVSYRAGTEVRVPRACAAQAKAAGAAVSITVPRRKG